MTEGSTKERHVKYNEIPKVEWWDCSVGFTCFCGAEVVLGEDGEPSKCNCEREWRLDAKLMVKGEKTNDD